MKSLLDKLFSLYSENIPGEVSQRNTRRQQDSEAAEAMQKRYNASQFYVFAGSLNFQKTRAITVGEVEWKSN